MEKQIRYEYHGQIIIFDEERDEWRVVFDHKEQRHKSLQIIKDYIDKRNKKVFKRIPVFIQKD